MKNELRNQIRSILSEVLNTTLLAVDNPRRNELANWDSLKHMELILRLEEQFHIRFSIKEVADIQSLNDIVKIIEVKS
ncbi:acyl carrier protein [Paenibacillus mendelii]|uniref:Acyl carrier protein n=1 Tax=Paenibacillus mendelii TaxID=206163 RepID=A0ABV6J981_9BACL|nr:acyl carrier protein [Paenibacillus mendelii]MCQ6559704.1 acyl carrier protein [Paenibacillus mendelii]